MNSDNAKVNRGLVVDIPEISVNKFGSTMRFAHNWDCNRAFFLTHFDNEISTDVLNEKFLNLLSNPARKSRLYLHELAFQYLRYITTTDIIKNGDEKFSALSELKDAGKIVFLETNRRTRLHFRTPNGTCVDVTAMSSGSNVGCIMILFELVGEEEKRILYTGDCRLTLNDLRNNPNLHNPNGTVKRIDKIYLDTTFCIYNVKELPARNRTTTKLAGIIGYGSHVDETRHFDIRTPRKVQHLAFLLTMANQFPQGLHVPPNMASFLQNVSGFQGLFFDESFRRDRVHYDCGPAFDNYYCGGNGEWNVDFDVVTVDLNCSIRYQFEFPRSQFPSKDEEFWCESGIKVYNDGDAVHGVYSSSLSRYEIGRMLNYLNLSASDVIPLYKSPQMDDFEMVLLLELAIVDTRLMEEPKQIKEELPSHFYDFTPPIKPHDAWSAKPLLYMH